MIRHLQLPVRWRSYGRCDQWGAWHWWHMGFNNAEGPPFAPLLFAILLDIFWLPISRFDRRQTQMRSRVAQETVTP